MGDAGVVDQSIKATEVVAGGLDQPLNVVGAGDVGGDREYPLGGIQFLLALPEQRLVDVGHDQAVAGVEPALGHRPAEAGGGAGDQNDFHWGRLPLVAAASFKL